VNGRLEQLSDRVSQLQIQLQSLQQSMDRISRDISIAIVGSAALIGLAIWTARRVPSVMQKRKNDS
jgi:hypothetical protein